MACQSARLRERDITDLTFERPHVEMSPVVHNQARALCKYLVAAPELAHEAGLGAPGAVVDRYSPLEGPSWQGFEAGIRLMLLHIFPV